MLSGASSCTILEMTLNPLIKVRLDNNKEVEIKKKDILSKKYKVSEYMEYDCTILDKNETNIRIKLKDFELFWMLWRYRKNSWARMIARIIPEITKEFENVDPKKEKNQLNINKFILSFIFRNDIEEGDRPEVNKNEYEKRFREIFNDKIGDEYLFDEDEDSVMNVELFNTIVRNSILSDNFIDKERIRTSVLYYVKDIIPLAHYLFFTNFKIPCTTLNKSLTRCYHLYNDNSPF